MVPPSHSRIGRYHAWVTRRPVAVLVGALFVFALSTALAMRLKLKTAFSELLPSNDPGVVSLARTQKRLGDLSLLLIGIRSPDREANLRYAEALTQKLRALPPTVVDLATYHVRDVRDFFEANKWLYVSEDGPRSDPRSPAHRDQQRKNPLFVSLGERGVGRCDARAHVGKERPRRKFPGGVFRARAGWRIRLDRGAAAGRAVRRKRGRGAVQCRQRADRGGPADPVPPAMKVEVRRADRHGIASRHAVERDISG